MKNTFRMQKQEQGRWTVCEFAADTDANTVHVTRRTMARGVGELRSLPEETLSLEEARTYWTNLSKEGYRRVSTEMRLIPSFEDFTNHFQKRGSKVFNYNKVSYNRDGLFGHMLDCVFSNNIPELNDILLQLGY